MSKGYEKDVNGKWKLTDKQEPQIIINQQQSRLLSLEELDARLKRLEGIVIGPQK